MKNYIQPGKILDHVAAADLTSGVAFLMGSMLAVPQTDIATGETGSVSVCGVYEVAMDAADTASQGDLLYWDSAEARLTTVALGNTHVAYAAEDVATSATVKALLGGSGVVGS